MDFRLIEKCTLCKCGCGQIVKPGKKYIRGHSNKGNKFTIKAELDPFEIQNLRSKGIVLSFCECGCEKFTKPGNRFIHGHSRRGIKHSIECKNKVAKGVKKYYQENSEKKKIMSVKLKEYFQKFGNNFTRGYTHTKENKKKMSVIRKGYFKIPGNKDYLRNQIISEKTKEKMSIAASLRMLKSKAWKRGYYFSRKNDKNLYYRSSYELIAYKILEQMSMVKSYEVEPCVISYRFLGILRCTIPNILVTYIDGSKELIEIKPEWKMSKDNTKLWAMNDYAANKGWLFNVWTENELGLT